ncbi:MAG: hypothetical protein NC548_25905 [Lachnospiraceae bacterium]|nr:hypothetical protein [Lachnospiraceae bacterium]
MASYSRIDTMVRATVTSRPEKIAICPFAEEGMMAKQILNQRYGIEETYIIDNRLAEINPNIVSVEDLKERDTKDLIVLLMIQNKEINQVLENQLRAIDAQIQIQNVLRPAWMFVPEKKDFFQTLRQCLRIRRPAGDMQLRRLGKKYDGGYVLLDDFAEDMKVYSFGICTDVSFEKELAGRGLQIEMYDHTIAELPEQHVCFHFHKTGISHIDEPENSKLSMKTLLRDNGDLGNKRLLLKMDVEGAEWDFLESTPSEILDQFRQITFELHRLADNARKEQIIGCLNKLNKTHQAVWIHANNFGHIERAGDGLEIPAYVEITYLNKTVYRTEDGSCKFPLPIDMPDDPSIEEYLFGDWGK